MSKKTLWIVIAVLLVGVVVALLITRSSGDTNERGAPDQANNSPTGTRQPGPGPSADPGVPESKPVAAPNASSVAASKPGAPKLTDEQIKSIIELCRQAGTAYVAAKHQQAQILANKALEMDPNNEFALRIAGAAACALKMQSNAQAVYSRLDPSSSARNLLVNVCKRNGITLATGPQSASEPASAPATDPSSPGAPAAKDTPEGKPAKLSSTAVQATIKQVRKSIEQCTKGQKGLVRVRMTVEGSGKVTDAAAVGQHASTPTGACVKDVVLKMTFPSFTGPSRTFIFPIMVR